MALYIDSAFLHDIMNVTHMDMLTDLLTEEAVERFTEDWQKMNRS